MSEWSHLLHNIYAQVVLTYVTQRIYVIYVTRIHLVSSPEDSESVS